MLTLKEIMGKQGLLFIPDISGFTRFIHETEIEHSSLSYRNYWRYGQFIQTLIVKEKLIKEENPGVVKVRVLQKKTTSIATAARDGSLFLRECGGCDV